MDLNPFMIGSTKSMNIEHTRILMIPQMLVYMCFLELNSEGGDALPREIRSITGFFATCSQGMETYLSRCTYNVYFFFVLYQLFSLDMTKSDF